MATTSTDESRGIAVVTGAAGGIGGAIVTRLVARGFRVAALDRDIDALGSLYASSDGVRCFAIDVTNHARVADVARVIEAELGAVVALVNNAGVFIRTPALGYDEADVARVLATNLAGALSCTSAFCAAMARRRSGRVVNVASIAAATGAALAAAYAASKAGLVVATASHARELAPAGIAVNAVLPGYTRTAMLAPDSALAEKFVLPRIPLRRFAEPAEIAEVVEMLLTLNTPYLTGAAIPIDGGLHVG